MAIRYKADMPALQVALLASARRYVPSLVLAIRIARVFGKSAEEVFILEGEELP